MALRCSICSHPSRSEIERGLTAGISYRTLAGQFGLSISALCRHSKHLAHQRDLQVHRDEQAYQAGLIEKLALLDHRLDRLFNSALDVRSLNVSLGCIRESLRLISLLERCRLNPGGRP
jgi:hypothetical protein